jgi:hypothetical protein
VRLRAPLFGLILAAGIQLPAQSGAPPRASEAPRVVFVCEHGSVKSLMAASYFNQRAQAKGLRVRAVARGVDPERTVPPAVRDGLRAAGFDVSEYRPQLLRASDVEGATLVVSFDEDVFEMVAGRARYVKWDNLPSVLSNYARGKDAILERIDGLLAEIAGVPRSEQ